MFILSVLCMVISYRWFSLSVLMVAFFFSLNRISRLVQKFIILLLVLKLSQYLNYPRRPKVLSEK